MPLFSRKKKTEEKKLSSKDAKSLSDIGHALSKKKGEAHGKKIEKKEFTLAYKFLEYPVVTEKSVNLADKLNQYVFRVRPEANKSELKKIIQDLYGVKVEKINLVKVPGKKRRLGRFVGYRSGFKKAIVFLSPGEKIDLMTR